MIIAIFHEKLIWPPVPAISKLKRHLLDLTLWTTVLWATTAIDRWRHICFYWKLSTTGGENRCGVALGDNPFFTWMNIFFEWINWDCFEWIHSLNEYFSTNNWRIIEWIKTCDILNKKKKCEKVNPNTVFLDEKNAVFVQWLSEALGDNPISIWMNISFEWIVWNFFWMNKFFEWIIWFCFWIENWIEWFFSVIQCLNE